MDGFVHPLFFILFMASWETFHYFPGTSDCLMQAQLLK